MTVPGSIGYDSHLTRSMSHTPCRFEALGATEKSEMWTIKTFTSTGSGWWGYLTRGNGAMAARPIGADRTDLAGLRLTLAMLGILAAAAVLRLHGLDRTSIWNDEAASWNMARHPFWTMIQEQTGDNNPPLFDIILFVMIRLFGDSETVLRLPSAILGITNVYLIYRLGSALWDRLTGVLGAALLALSGFHIWYSQEARMYSLFCLTATAFALMTVLFVTAPSRTRAALWGFSGVALLYSHTYGPLTWAAINAFVGVAWLMRARWLAADGRACLIVQALVALSFAPWVAALLHQVQTVMQGFWIPFPSPNFLYWTFNSMASGTAMLACLALLVPLSFLSVANDSPAMGKDAAKITPRARPVITPGWQNGLLLCWAVFPFLVEYAVSVAARPLIVSHYLISSLPPILLLAARGLSVLRFNRVLLFGAGIVILACAWPGVHRSLVTNQREDFRAAVEAFSTHFTPADEILFASPGARNAFEYYFRPPVAREAVIGEAGTNSDEVLSATRIWVFARSGVNHTAPLFEDIEAKFVESRIFDFYGVTVYLFSRPCDGNARSSACPS